MLPIKTDLAHRANYGGRRTAKIEYIVIHYTGNDGDSSEGNANYFKQALNPVASAHYFVDDDSIVCSVPEDFVAYHCGGTTKYYHPRCRNANSIGIELCDARRDGSVMATDKTIRNAAELVNALMKKYGIPPQNIVRHYDVTHKLCPAYWVKNPQGFEDFKILAQEADEVITKSYMIVDGKKVEVERILKDGTNFVKIRDVAKALDLEVGFQGNIAVLNRK